MRRPMLLLTALYSLAWAPILLMQGVYWDGWVYYAQYFLPDHAYIWATEFGPQRLYIHFEIFQFIASTPDPVFTQRVIVFLCWLFAGLLLYKILTKALQWDAAEAFLVSAYYLVFPAFIVRFEIIHPFYSIANFFFVLAAYLYLVPPHTPWKRVGAKVAAIPFFILSFFVNSFLVFYFVFLAAHAYLASKRSSIVEDFKAYVFRYWYLITLPFAFFTFALIYMQPYGASSEHYNELIVFREGASLGFLISSFVSGFWSGIWTGVIWPFASAFTLLERKFFVVALVLALALVIFLLRRFSTKSEETNFRLYWFSLSRQRALFIASGALILIALFPYVAVGKPPHIYGYGFGIRHTLLMPLGMALLLYGGICTLVREQFQKGVHITIFSLSIAFLWYNFFLLDIDWYKQQAIMHELPAVIAGAPPGTFFVFDDQTASLSWRSRPISHHEYSGYLTLLTESRNYRGASVYDYGTIDGRGLYGTSTVYVDITSKKSSDPRVMDWVYLKTIDLFGGDLPVAAQDKLQIILTQKETTAD